MWFLKKLVLVLVVLGGFSVFLIATGKWDSAVIAPVNAIFGSPAAHNVNTFATGANTLAQKLFGTTSPGVAPTVNAAAVTEVLRAIPGTRPQRLPPYSRNAYGPPPQGAGDHIVPLRAAWTMGAAEWSTRQRTTFANDPAGLLTVSSSVAKTQNGCVYAAKYVYLAATYHLHIGDKDRAALIAALKTCPAH